MKGFDSLGGWARHMCHGACNIYCRKVGSQADRVPPLPTHRERDRRSRNFLVILDLRRIRESGWQWVRTCMVLRATFCVLQKEEWCGTGMRIRMFDDECACYTWITREGEKQNELCKSLSKLKSTQQIPLRCTQIPKSYTVIAKSLVSNATFRLALWPWAVTKRGTASSKRWATTYNLACPIFRIGSCNAHSYQSLFCSKTRLMISCQAFVPPNGFSFSSTMSSLYTPPST